MFSSNKGVDVGGQRWKHTEVRGNLGREDFNIFIDWRWEAKRVLLPFTRCGLWSDIPGNLMILDPIILSTQWSWGISATDIDSLNESYDLFIFNITSFNLLCIVWYTVCMVQTIYQKTTPSPTQHLSTSSALVEIAAAVTFFFTFSEDFLRRHNFSTFSSCRFNSLRRKSNHHLQYHQH